MELKDWIILFVPIVFGTIFTIFITNINNKRISKRNKKKQIVNDIFAYVSKIRESIHKMQFQLVENFEKEMQNYFVLSGNLQIYVQDNMETILKLNKYSRKEKLKIKSIEELTNTIKEVGQLLTCKDKLDVFGKKFKDSEVLCVKIIKELKQLLLKFD